MVPNNIESRLTRLEKGLAKVTDVVNGLKDGFAATRPKVDLLAVGYEIIADTIMVLHRMYSYHSAVP